jgi:hypothetical protein
MSTDMQMEFLGMLGDLPLYWANHRFLEPGLYVWVPDLQKNVRIADMSFLEEKALFMIKQYKVARDD